MKSLILYDSLGGNTERAANTIYETSKQELTSSNLIKVSKETKLDFLDYDLVFIGCPVIDWLPTKTMMDFVKKTTKEYNKNGLIKPAAPIIPGKFSICFGTFAGPHIGKLRGNRTVLNSGETFRRFMGISKGHDVLSLTIKEVC
jgi:flavodoxin